MFAVASLLAFAASAAALSVTQPSNSTGWTTSGPNAVTWSSVSTDRSNFTVVLNNQNSYPAYTEVLDALVVTSDGSVTVNPPSGGWVAGSGYRVNFVQDSNDLNAILAQSEDFTITQSSSSTFTSGASTASSSASSSGSVSVTAPGSSATDSSASGTDSSAGTSASSASGSSSSTNAAPGLNVQTGVFGLLALLGVALA
ncbi:uncharacterized protein C8Q71DRAFT_29568 [Rhodofomes roseus]|uniref:Yeast cell wall synthesis Kre9/Knh1-like N-terminal domain-containing protein n=1 Tax=Rhodofomes roseus TaxID=34475 RepID=A0A4Y9Z7R9_9APHY|nr:uncharacterized protein C8Q71DRAFT_29568 [Rhodofomes roseus]KAH9844094.1 hypothetical protein C8Q71DRAFT_29568 [Rhodofomes roseus]TFY69419.1 hypothetical protein EVJ58_g420 [Rhodofomes roseus]